MGKDVEKKEKDGGDDYTSEFDWIQVRERMDQEMKPETFLGKLNRKFGENPLVPIGAVATLGALSVGLWNFRLGRAKVSQKMMRLRIAAQGFTVVALISGMFMAATSTIQKGPFLEAPGDVKPAAKHL